MMNSGFIGYFIALVILLVSFGTEAQSLKFNKHDTSNSSEMDCDNVEIDYVTDENLTPDENLERMDQLFYRSLAHYDACRNSKKLEANRHVVDEVHSANIIERNSTTISSSSDVYSDINRPRKNSDDNDFQEWSATKEEETAQSLRRPFGEETKPKLKGAFVPRGVDEGLTIKFNGKSPDDIPVADNDTLLEAQIRRAANLETEPQKKAQLWDEYRKYKGLPMSNEDKSRN